MTIGQKINKNIIMGIQERKGREKEQRKSDIIDAAEKVFFKKGIESATMDEVAETAELSKGTLYTYFKSKEDLHFAICIRGLELLKDRFEKAINKDISVLQNLVQIGIAFVQFSKENTDYFKVMSHFENKEIIESEHAHQHTEKDDVMELMIKLIENGKKDGSIRNDIDPGIISHILWAQTTGVLQLMAAKKFHLDTNKITEEDIIKNHFEIVANGIRSSSEPLNLKQYFKK